MESGTGPSGALAEREEESPTRSGPELTEAAARGAKLDQKEQEDATAWLLSDSPEAAPQGTRSLEINVGTDEEPKQILWTVRAIDGDELRRIQNRVNNPRSVRRGGGEPDELEYHSRVVVAGTVEPDIKGIAKQKGAADPASFLRARFSHKPGLIPQLTAEIMQLSGFDDSHVQEIESGKR